MRRTPLHGALLVALVSFGVIGTASGASALPAAAGARAAESAATGSTSTTVRSSDTGPVVVIGAAGLRWTDMSASTGAITDLSDRAATATLSVRSVHEASCPVDGWLTLSAGRRAADDVEGGTSCVAPTATIGDDGKATVTGWSDYVALAEAGTYDARPGLLGDTLAAAGVETAAVGAGAAVALATSDGTVEHAWAGVTDLDSGAADPEAEQSTLYTGVAEALETDAQVIMVDVGSVRVRAEGDTTQPSRVKQVLALDDRISLVMQALPDDATVIVAGLSDSDSIAHLGLVAALGPAGEGGATTSTFSSSSTLWTASTRQKGIVQVTDLMPTVLKSAGVALPDTLVGSPLTTAERTWVTPSRANLITLTLASVAARRLVPQFWIAWAVCQAIVYLFVWLLLRGNFLPARTQQRVRGVFNATALAAAACLPASYWVAFVPWAQAEHQAWTMLGWIFAFACGTAFVALAGPWRRSPFGPWGVVGGVAALTLVVDALTGSQMQINTVIGENPVVAGRFYGWGNAAFSIAATGVLVAATAGAHALLARGRRREAVGVVVALGLLVAVVDAVPGWGTDVGGALPLALATAYLALRVADITMSWQRWAALVGGVAGAGVVLAVVDWLRPAADRTHLGRFVQEMIEGQGWSVIARKAVQNFEITTRPVALLVPVLGLLVAWAMWRPAKARLALLDLTYTRMPLVRALFAALGLLWVVGFALNDTGAVVPAVGAALTLVPLVRLMLIARDDQARDEIEAAVAETVRLVKKDKKSKSRRR